MWGWVNVLGEGKYLLVNCYDNNVELFFYKFLMKKLKRSGYLN